MANTDDAPLWAEVWAMWFGLGMCLRTWVHMSCASDVADPAQISWPVDDRTLRSPVAQIRGTKWELMSVIISAVTGVWFWVLLPLTPPGPMHTPVEYWTGVWLTTQVIPLLGDPVALAIAQLNSHSGANNAATMTESD